ncbi:putative class I glutamine amidotransferase [Helianthus annuus]|nr:putative class I glutamine amidotransferase [Helianthus annuus]
MCILYIGNHIRISCNVTCFYFCLETASVCSREIGKYQNFHLHILPKMVLCRALGGKVGKSDSGWDIGLRKVNIVKDFSPCSFLETFVETPPALTIIECHQDEVWEVPTGAQVIAFSDKTGVEMFTIGDHILGIQGHPEYPKDILNNLIDRLLNQDSIETELANVARSKLETADPDNKCWQEICKAFLKGYWNPYLSIEQ